VVPLPLAPSMMVRVYNPLVYVPQPPSLHNQWRSPEASMWHRPTSPSAATERISMQSLHIDSRPPAMRASDVTPPGPGLRTMTVPRSRLRRHSWNSPRHLPLQNRGLPRACRWIWTRLWRQGWSWAGAGALDRSSLHPLVSPQHYQIQSKRLQSDLCGSTVAALTSSPRCGHQPAQPPPPATSALRPSNPLPHQPACLPRRHPGCPQSPQAKLHRRLRPACFLHLTSPQQSSRPRLS